MGGTVKFKVSDLQKVIEASSAEVMLVGDQGVYFCSDIMPEGAEKRVVAYAKGLNPDVDEFESWWEKKRKIYGGDDGVDRFPLENIKNLVAAAVKEDKATLSVKFTQTSISFKL